MWQMGIQPLGQEDSLGTGWQATSVFLLRERHGQRSLAAYSFWDHRVRQD